MHKMELPVRLVHPDAELVAQTALSENVFFGFHDITPWSPDGLQLLCLRLHPSWQSMSDTAKPAEICLWSPALQTITPIGQTQCWNFQQAARQQWLPDGSGRLSYNRLGADGSCVGVVADIHGTVAQEFAGGLYVIAPDARWALAPDFSVLARRWPAYGYASQQTHSLSADQNMIGISRIDMATGKRETLVSLADVLRDWRPKCNPEGHFLTHPSISPDGRNIVFLHRFFAEDEGSFTRLLTCTSSGAGLRVLAEEKISHFDWLDSETLLVWARFAGGGLAHLRASGRLNAPYLRPFVNLARRFTGTWKKRILSESYVTIALDGVRGRSKYAWPELDCDGHPMAARSHGWIVTDMYPDAARQMPLILWNNRTRTRIDVAKVDDGVSSADSDAKCDLHPRWNRDETMIAVDCCAAGLRRISIFDVSAIVQQG